MQYDVNTPSEYLEALENDWRKNKLMEIRDLILKNKGIEEGINYKMLSYRDKKGIILHLNAQSGYVSVYVGDADKIDKDGKLLDGIARGKGCLRIRKSTDIPATRLNDFLIKTIKMWKGKKDIDC